MGLAQLLSTEHLVTNFCNFFVIQHQSEVCPLSREVMLPGGATPILAITARHSLFPTSPTRTPFGSPYGSLSQRDSYYLTGRDTGLTRSA